LQNAGGQSRQQPQRIFRVTAAEARDALTDLSGELMTFVEEPEALEYRHGLEGATGRVSLV
jgi:hypothetical protein